MSSRGFSCQYSIPPFVRNALERRRIEFRDLCNSDGEFRSFRIDLIAERLFQSGEFRDEGILPAGVPGCWELLHQFLASGNYIAAVPFRRALWAPPLPRREETDIRDSSVEVPPVAVGTVYVESLYQARMPETYSRSYDAIREASRTLELTNETEIDRHLQAWIDFVHGWGANGPSTIDHASRYSTDVIDPTKPIFVSGARLTPDWWRRPEGIQKVPFIDECGQPAVVVSEIAYTLTASARAIEAILDGALGEVPYSSPWSDPEAADCTPEASRAAIERFVRDHGFQVAEFERTRWRLLRWFGARPTSGTSNDAMNAEPKRKPGRPSSVEDEAKRRRIVKEWEAYKETAGTGRGRGTKAKFAKQHGVTVSYVNAAQKWVKDNPE